MAKLTLLLLFSCFSIILFAQNDFLVFKKGNKSISYFYKNSRISFQLKNKDWMKGIITKIENDSFYFTKEVIIYTMTGADSMHFSGYHYALSDIYALPKRGVQVDWTGNNFQITKSGGHQHFYWIKSGWLFRTGGLGYAGLSLFNSIVKNDYSFSTAQIVIPAAAFLGGAILKKTYKLTHVLGKKYYLQTVKI